MSGFSTINSRRSKNRNRFNRKSSIPKTFECDLGFVHSHIDFKFSVFILNISGMSQSNFSGWSGSMGVCHVESLYITLIADRGKGYGITLAVGEHSDNSPADILVARITPDSPAYR